MNYVRCYDTEISMLASKMKMGHGTSHTPSMFILSPTPVHVGTPDVSSHN